MSRLRTTPSHGARRVLVGPDGLGAPVAGGSGVDVRRMLLDVGAGPSRGAER